MKKSAFLAGLVVTGSLAPSVLAQTRAFHKTPDGIAQIVLPSDSILAPAPVGSKLSLSAQPDLALVQGAVQLLEDSLTALGEKSDEKDSQWYENGVWHNSQEKLWQVQSGPAVAAAMLWKWRSLNGHNSSETDKTRQAWLHKVAVETFDRHIKDRQKPGGAMDDSGTHVQFFAADLGQTYLTLGDSLDAATKTRWRESLVRVVESFISNGDLPDPTKTGWKGTSGWYTNGNVDLYEAEMLYLTGKITGEKRYQDLFETQWKHTLLPSQDRWKNYGLFYLKEPTKADGSDGAGYVSESAAKPGFDPEYTQLQLSVTSRLFLSSGDPRALKLMNLMLNALMPRVDESSWLLDATYGSRHSVITPLFTAAPEVGVWFGNRADFAPKIGAHFEKATQRTYLDNARKNQGAPGLYRGYGIDPAVILQAAIAAGK